MTTVCRVCGGGLERGRHEIAGGHPFDVYVPGRWYCPEGCDQIPMTVDDALACRGWRSWQDPMGVDVALAVLADEVDRLRVIERAAHDVIDDEMPHECYHPELRRALGEPEGTTG